MRCLLVLEAQLDKLKYIILINLLPKNIIMLNITIDLLRVELEEKEKACVISILLKKDKILQN